MLDYVKLKLSMVHIWDEKSAGEHRHIQNCSFAFGTHSNLKGNHWPISVLSTKAAAC